MTELTQLESLVQGMLSEKRFAHTLAVREQALRMAQHYHADPYAAQAAALLHDFTKEIDSRRQLKTITESGIISDTVILDSPQLYHAVTAFLYARDQLGIDCPDILNAIRYHTTARRGMSVLEQVVYIADATSQDRDYPDAGRFRTMAFQGLDLCMHAVLQHTITYLVQDSCLIPEDTWYAYNSYCICRKG